MKINNSRVDRSARRWRTLWSKSSSVTGPQASMTVALFHVEPSGSGSARAVVRLQTVSEYLPTASYRDTRDFLPAEMSVRTQVFHRLYEVIERYGY